MRQRWAYLATGVMAGVIAVLLAALVFQNRDTQAWAAPQGTDNTGTGLVMTTGGSQQSIQDILWVMFKRKAESSGSEEIKGALAKSERITLCCYQVLNNARLIKLVAARDISYDMDIVELANDKPHVKEIIEELKRVLPKEAKETK